MFHNHVAISSSWKPALCNLLPGLLSEAAYVPRMLTPLCCCESNIGESSPTQPPPPCVTRKDEQPARYSTATEAIIQNNNQLTQKVSKLIIFGMIFLRKIAANGCGKPDSWRTETILCICGCRHMFSKLQTQRFLRIYFKNDFKNDVRVIFNAIIILILNSDVFFKQKGNTVWFLPSVGVRENFPPGFSCRTAALLPAIQTLLEVKNAAPPAHRRLHLVLQSQNPREKEERGKKPVDNNDYRFLSSSSKITGLPARAFPCCPPGGLESRLKGNETK